MSEGLLIRNKFTIFEDRVLVELPGDKLLICDYDNLSLVEMHNWYCFSNGYAVTWTSGTTTQQCFHNMVMKHILTEIIVDHININCLDNRQANLCLVDHRAQCINQGCQVNNKTGVTGVSYKKNSKYWVAKWQDADGNQCCKSFGSKKYGNAEA